MNSITNKLPLFFAGFTLLLSACDDNEDPAPVQIETEIATDLPADPDNLGDITYFSFENGIVTGGETSMDWDIAFSGTSIFINGGTSGPGAGQGQIITGVFENVNEAPEDGYFVDTSEQLAIQGSDGERPGWYNYTGEALSGPQHAILSVPGRVIILKTASGNYARMEIISYYQGNPDTTTPEFAELETRPASRYYTFKYAVQPDGSRSF